MKITRRTGLKLMGASALAASPLKALAGSHATVHEVQMLNKHPEDNERMVFYPDIVRAQPGDTIKFIATDRGHNSQSNDDMMPEGGESWNGKINDDVEVTLETEGAYGYYCTPHQSVGMVGLILVGDVSSNYEAVKEARQRGRARERYEDIFARADEMLEAESS